jgi:hypothetical protein
MSHESPSGSMVPCCWVGGALEDLEKLYACDRSCSLEGGTSLYRSDVGGRNRSYGTCDRFPICRVIPRFLEDWGAQARWAKRKQ